MEHIASIFTLDDGYCCFASDPPSIAIFAPNFFWSDFAQKFGLSWHHLMTWHPNFKASVTIL
jgi:hypothetical protein